MKAVNGVIKQITCDGCVQGFPMAPRYLPTGKITGIFLSAPMPYGQSMALMMLVEAGKHFRE